MWNRILEFAQRGYHAMSAKPLFDVVPGVPEAVAAHSDQVRASLNISLASLLARN